MLSFNLHGSSIFRQFHLIFFNLQGDLSAKLFSPTVIAICKNLNPFNFITVAVLFHLLCDDADSVACKQIGKQLKKLLVML
jgi:uncharacterized membrane protein